MDAGCKILVCCAGFISSWYLCSGPAGSCPQQSLFLLVYPSYLFPPCLELCLLAAARSTGLCLQTKPKPNQSP